MIGLRRMLHNGKRILTMNSCLIFRCILFLFFVFFQSLSLAQVSSSFADSVWQRMDGFSSNAEKLDSMIALSVNLAKLESSKSLELARLGQSKAVEFQDEVRSSQFNLRLGSLNVNIGEFEKAMSYFDLVRQTAEKTGDQSQLALVFQKKGMALINQGQFQNAMENYMKSLRIYEGQGDQIGMGSALVSLADVFFYLERYREGVEYGMRAVNIFKELDEKVELLFAYQIVSDNYLGTEEYDNALAYIDQALNMAKSMGVSQMSMASLHNARGNVLKYHKRYDEAIEEYRTSHQIAKEYNSPGGMTATLANISDVYMRKGDFKSALSFQLQSFEIMNEKGLYMNRLENIDNLSTIYKELGDYENALIYREQHQNIRDSVMSLEKDKITKELSTKYQTEKKEELIGLQKEKLARQKLVQMLAIGFVGLLLAVLLLLYRSFKQKKKNNILLAETNKKLDIKNRENELLLKEIHHRVKNNLQTISSLLSLQSESIRDQSALDAVQESRNRVASMALIHQKLYQRDNLAAIEMRDYFESIGKTIIDSFGEKAHHVALNVSMENIELDVDTAVPIGLIANELITNSLKYAFSDQQQGQINITMSRHENNLLKLQIADNGRFISREQNDPEHDGSGFGTLLIQLLTAQLGGKLETHIENGTSTVILFSPHVKSVA
jgi:two-component sensor histidine kinase/Tfp pilus assembly protein PilF